MPNTHFFRLQLKDYMEWYLKLCMESPTCISLACRKFGPLTKIQNKIRHVASPFLESNPNIASFPANTWFSIVMGGFHFSNKPLEAVWLPKVEYFLYCTELFSTLCLQFSLKIQIFYVASSLATTVLSTWNWDAIYLELFYGFVFE